MRYLIGFLLFFACYQQSFANSGLSFNVEDYRQTELEFMFEIENHKFDRVVLDCQSFINGLNFYRGNDNIGLFILDIGECQHIHFEIQEYRKRNLKACVHLDFDSRTYEITESNELCL